MSFSIAGKRILVTGGVGGVGGGSVRHFAREGANIVALDIRDEEGMLLAKEATEAGPGQVTYRRMDASSTIDIRESIEWAVDHLGGLDGILTAHGGPILSWAAETPESDWDWQLMVNAKAVGTICQAVFPHLKDNGGGSIVNIAAGGALKDGPIKTSSYSASKGAVLSYTRSIALEWAPYKIRANCVNPVVATPKDDQIQALMTPEERERFRRQIHESIPLGHMGDVETELAPALQFLLSDAAKFVTSQIWGIDGGLCPSR
ncbi:SDR family NAD(P)-dependent oxidoreductase [Arthrobacter nitrophenolicus]|uniref:NAD(P)-dependent dehydrogenase (Short-subunit alcohol dehydrogenase family) n=2 Tax=Arthrobacter nitrophenolicus TaxID=683150 RepID=A0ACC6TKG5_9MICC|nr:SDR family oxidoreductase [Arthrobacter nitrophenolicus]ELT43040.1 3-oxoacyl-ACP reductase [Arthrobacter nitrophenolicus]